MALSGAVVWEVRASAGSDNNGGGFVAGASGTDRSQQNAAFASGTNLTVDATTNTDVLPDGHTPDAADVGNLIQITAGAGFTTGFYQIASIQAGKWRLDRSPAATGTSGGTWAIGGALATLGKLAGAMVANNMAHATGAFTTTATITFAPGNSGLNGASPTTRLRGYGSTRGDSGRATLTLSTNTGITGISSTSNGFWVENFAIDCASLGTSTGIALGFGGRVYNCKVENFTSRGINFTSALNLAKDCELTGGTAAATAAVTPADRVQMAGCFIHDNGCPGVVTTGVFNAFGNLIVNNSGASSDGLRIAGGCFAVGNTIHNNGRDGIRLTNATELIPYTIKNNLLSNNGGYGLNNQDTAIGAFPDHDGNAYYSNTSGTRNNVDSNTGVFGSAPYTNADDVILSASPYVGPTTGTSANFGLNGAAGGGADLKGQGYPSAWPGNTGSTGYPDIGAVLPQATAGGGIVKRVGCGGGLVG